MLETAGHNLSSLFLFLDKNRESLFKLQISFQSDKFFDDKKINFEYPRKIVEMLWVKTRENDALFDFLADDYFDFTRKIVKKKKIWAQNS